MSRTRAALLTHVNKPLEILDLDQERPSVDFGIPADLAMEKRINLDDLISRTYKFEDTNEGFKLMPGGSVARGVITFN